MSIVWLSNVIDQKGIGNGTSILIFTNIIVSILNQIRSTGITPTFIEFFFLLILVAVLTISQSARLTLKVVSARQLAFLEKREIKEELKRNKEEAQEPVLSQDIEAVIAREKEN
jgi:preprotein translocase subunit SecY